MELRAGPVFLSSDQVSLAFCLLSSYLFSFIYYSFLVARKNENIKHIFMVAVSQLFMMACFDWIAILNVYLPIVVIWCFGHLFHKKTWMPVAGFALIIGHLSTAHIVRQFFQEGASSQRYVMDVTAPLMMLTIKLTSFLFDTHDAYNFFTRTDMKSPKAVEKCEDATREHKEKLPVSERQSKMPLVEPAKKHKVISKYPSLLEFLGYALLFPGFLAGPTISFYEYRTFINGSYFEGIDLSKEALPGRKRRALKQFLSSLLFAAIYISGKEKFTPSYLVTDEYVQFPMWRKLLVLHFTNLVHRSKYYFAWIIAEGSYVIIGLGFRMTSNKKPLWDRLENVNPWRIELNSDFRRLVSEWNVCTNQWLHTYIYRRIGNYYYGKKRPGARASLATYITSALWHGFYPGYYLMFISAAWMTIFSRLIYRSFVWPFGYKLRNVILYVPVFILVDYIMIPFLMLDLQRSFRIWAVLHYFGHIFLAIGTASLLLIQKVKRH